MVAEEAKAVKKAQKEEAKQAKLQEKEEAKVLAKEEKKQAKIQKKELAKKESASSRDDIIQTICEKMGYTPVIEASA